MTCFDLRRENTSQFFLVDLKFIKLYKARVNQLIWKAVCLGKTSQAWISFDERPVLNL